jgi:two-component system, OmpR family, phosphate regulon sensor histidine kinase PhoR
MPAGWGALLGPLALLAGVALVVGWILGGTGWWLSAALALYLALTLRRLHVLDRVLSGIERAPNRPERGFWHTIFARVEGLRAKSRSRKQKLHRLMREVRESTHALTDAGIILNAEREIVWFNPAATRLLGLDPAVDLGNRIENLLRHPDFISYVMKPGETGVVIPSPVTHHAWLHVQVIPYGMNQKLAIVRDVTRETRLETTRRDFVANASHELRSPVTVISGYLEALSEDDRLPENWKAPIGEMQRQAERMMQILRDLIELARLEASDERAPRNPVDVPALLELIRRAYVGGKGPQVTLQLHTDVWLKGREAELHSIFQNLVENAVRFTPAAGTVTMHWRETGSGAEFEVIDTGIGIAEEQIPRITERFYRVDPGRSRATGGTGLGLAIVKHALQRHEGQLAISSREGEGSTFTCRFPVSRVTQRESVATSA